MRKTLYKWLYYIPALMVAVLALCLVFIIATVPHTEPERETLTESPAYLIETPTLLIETIGRYTTVTDRAGGQQYQFTRRVVKRSQATTEVRRGVDTDTLTIDFLPGGGLRIHDLSTKTCYTVRPKGCR